MLARSLAAARVEAAEQVESVRVEAVVQVEAVAPTRAGTSTTTTRGPRCGATAADAWGCSGLGSVARQACRETACREAHSQIYAHGIVFVLQLQLGGADCPGVPESESVVYLRPFPRVGRPPRVQSALLRLDFTVRYFTVFSSLYKVERLNLV